MSEGLPNFKASINRLFAGVKLGPLTVDKRWSRFTGNFRNETHTLDSLIHELSLGHAVCCVLGGCSDPGCGCPYGWRKSDHFVEASLVFTDHDAGDESSSIPSLLADSFIRRYAACLYTTLSSTVDHPKSRVVYQWVEPFTDPSYYRKIVLAFLYRYPAADRSTHDPARFFYGAKPVSEIIRLGNILPLATAEEMIQAFAEALDRQEHSRVLPEVDPSRIVGNSKLERYVSAVVQGEVPLVEAAKEGSGERHLSLLKAAKALGSLLLATWLPSEIRAGIDPYRALIPAAKANGYIGKYGEEDAHRTIKDGLGYASPRRLPRAFTPAGWDGP